MAIPARVLFFVFVSCAVVSTATAQPAILTVQSPPANERGWTNSPARVEFLCLQAISCSDAVVVSREGAAQVVNAAAEDRAGGTATGSAVVNIDWTAPLVSIESPIEATTARASIAVVARASDEISKPLSATCNGRPATINSGGIIRCEVPLSVGANDVVVEVSDHADNSGSAGFRVVRTSPSPDLKVVPEVVGLIVGQVTTVQVQDAAGINARGVVWRVDNPAAVEISTDGRHVLTAKAPGMTWVRATVAGIEARVLVTVYAGDRLPMGSTRWQIGTLLIMQTPDTQPLKPDTANVLSTSRRDGLTLMESINRTTGWLNWRERPAAKASEIAVEIRELPAAGGGGGFLVFDDNDTGRSAIVRTAGRPWRYQSSGRIRPEMLLGSDGALLVMERPQTGFTQMVFFDGATGRVVGREPLPTGTHLVVNVGCITGANGARYLPAQVGPLQQARDIHFGLVVSNDREDFSVCGEVNGTFKRTVMVATARDGERRVDTAATIEVPATAGAPLIDLFEVTVDRHGARLLPWAARDAATGAREFRVTRVTDAGTMEYKLAGAGKIWLSGREDDLAVTTDGTHLIGFNVVTGAVVVSQAFEGGVQIMSVVKGQVIFRHLGGLTAADIPIQPPR